MSIDENFFNLDDILSVMDGVSFCGSEKSPLYEGGRGFTNKPFVYDVDNGRFTDQVTSFSPVIGCDIRDKSEVMLIYAKSTVKMQKAIRNTLYLFCYSHSLKQGYQGDILINWFEYCYEDWDRYLIAIDSYPETYGTFDCVSASVNDVKRCRLLMSKNVVDTSVPKVCDTPVDDDACSRLDRVPKMHWKDVSFENEMVVRSYMDNEFGGHVREALSILMKFPTYEQWLAVGDGPGVVNEACRMLKKTCYSTEISQAMVDVGIKRGNNVIRCDAMEAIRISRCPIIVMYCSLSIHGLLKMIVDEFPNRKVIVVSNVDAFEGRGGYKRYSGTSRLYFRNIEMPAGIKLRKSNMKPCNYSDFWDRESVYCIDNDRAYQLALAFRRMSIPILLSTYQSKYREGLLHVREASKNDIYMYDSRIQPAHKYYFNMNTGRAGKLREVIDHNEVDCGVYCTRGVINNGKFLASDNFYRYYEFAIGNEVIERHGSRVRKVYFDGYTKGVPITKMVVARKNIKRPKYHRKRRKK